MEDDARMLQGGSPFRMDHETPCHAQMHGQERRHRHSGCRSRGLQLQQGQLAPATNGADARSRQSLHRQAQGMQGTLAKDVHSLDVAVQYLWPQGADDGLHFRQFGHDPPHTKRPAEGRSTTAGPKTSAKKRQPVLRTARAAKMTGKREGTGQPACTVRHMLTATYGGKADPTG